MPSSKKIRKFIRHPAEVPIRVSLERVVDEAEDPTEQTITNVSLGGLAIVSDKPIAQLERVRISIPMLGEDNDLVGNVVWCEEASDGYEVGVEFDRSRDVYRMRMIEQICHIEHYRKEVARLEGRDLSSQEAAREWISRYAGDFPAL